MVVHSSWLGFGGLEPNYASLAFFAQEESYCARLYKPVQFVTIPPLFHQVIVSISTLATAAYWEKYQDGQSVSSMNPASFRNLLYCSDMLQKASQVSH